MAKRKMLNSDETSYLCEQLSYVMKAGIAFGDGLQIIGEDLEDKRLREIITAVGGYISDDKTISQAMIETGVFPAYAVKMVEIGSVTGKLEEVLASLAVYYEQRSEMKRTIMGAVLHPFMLLIMMAAVIVVLVIKVIPMFRSIFEQFDESAASLIDSSIKTAYGIGIIMLIVMFALIIAAAVIALFSKIPGFSAGIRNMLSGFFLTRRLSESIALTYFCNAMSMMSASGIEASESLEYAAPLVGNKKLYAKIFDCREKVINGVGFADSVHESGILPAMQSHTLKVSYQSGTFDAAWKKISDYYDEEANRSINNLIAFIEPVLIAVLAAVIGSVLLTIMIPLTEIMTSL